MDNKNQKPKIFLILKFIGFTLLAIGIILVITGITKDTPDMDNDNWFAGTTSKMFTIFGGVACCMFSIPVLIFGFRTEITKLNTKTTKYIQEENKDDLKDIASNTADISSDAITTTTKAIKKGLKDTKFCSECGTEIDANAKFCNNCGKEQ